MKKTLTILFSFLYSVILIWTMLYYKDNLDSVNTYIAIYISGFLISLPLKKRVDNKNLYMCITIPYIIFTVAFIVYRFNVEPIPENFINIITWAQIIILPFISFYYFKRNDYSTN